MLRSRRRRRIWGGFDLVNLEILRVGEYDIRKESLRSLLNQV
jgi:hypothetical protein